MRRIALVLACAALCGCASHQFYRLTRINGVPAIAPPGYRDAQRQVWVRVPGAVRKDAAGRAGCRVSLAGFTLRPLPGSRAAVAGVDLDVLVPGGAYDPTAREAFEGFKVELERLETGAGCLAPGAARLIAARVAESLPMPFQEVAFYRNGYDAFRASVELQPGMRITQQVVLEEGDSRIGVVFYQVGRRADGSLELKPAVADAAMPYYRLFLRTRFIHEPGGKPERNALLLGGPDLRTLFAATPQVLENAEAVCRGRNRLTCSVFPNRYTVAPEVPVSVHGKLGYVDVVATLGQLRPPESALARLRLRRLYAGRHVRVDLKGAGRLALKLPLAAGDQVSW